MKTDFEKIPVIVFGWLGRKEFAALSEAQQKVVLEYFTDSEYNEMHLAAVRLRHAAQITREQGLPGRKTALMERFENHHRKSKIVPLALNKSMAWQAAAMVLMLLSAWLFYKLFDLKAGQNQTIVAAKDTVYVNREVTVPAIIVHDTVYRSKVVYRQSAENSEAGAKPQKISGSDLNSGPAEVPVMNLDDLENKENSIRGNSMRDDSLLRKFGYVSL